MAYEPEIKIEVEDRRDPSKWVAINDWEGYTIAQNVWQPADNFTLRPSNPRIDYPKFLAGNQRARILVDGNMRFTGITDERTCESGANENTIAITGRDMAAVLVDSTAEPMSLGDLTLAQLAHKQADPWMPDYILSIVTDNAPNFYRLIGRKGTAIKKQILSIGPPPDFLIEKKDVVTGYRGSTKGGKSSPYYRGVDQDRIPTRLDGSSKIWEALDEHAKRAACAMWMTCDGSLFIGRPRYDENAHQAKLVHKYKGGNVRHVHWRAATAERFSNWRMLAQKRGKKNKGKGSTNLKVDVIDPGEAFHTLQNDGSLKRRFYRPTTIRVNNGCKDEKLLRRMTRTQMEMAILQTYDLVVTVEGHGWPPHRPDSPLWADDCCVDFTSEPYGIEGQHYVVAAELGRNKDNGVETKLRLIPAGIWLALDHDTVTDKEYQEYLMWKVWW